MSDSNLPIETILLIHSILKHYLFLGFAEIKAIWRKAVPAIPFDPFPNQLTEQQLFFEYCCQNKQAPNLLMLVIRMTEQRPFIFYIDSK